MCSVQFLSERTGKTVSVARAGKSSGEFGFPVPVPGKTVPTVLFPVPVGRFLEPACAKVRDLKAKTGAARITARLKTLNKWEKFVRSVTL